MKKIFAGLMSLAMVLGMAFGGASSADASTGSGTFNVTSTFGGGSPEVNVQLLSDSYIWGFQSPYYVQQRVTTTPNADYGFDIQMVSERYINNAWTVVEGSQRTVTADSSNSDFIVNQLIASNGVYKAKGKYRIQYTFIQYSPGGMHFDYGTSRQFNIN